MEKIVKLPNGSTLLYNGTDSTRSVAIGIYVGCGADYESEKQSGISHFIEHMLFKGTEKRTAFDIAREAESLGVQMNAFTARQMTSFYTVSTYEHAEDCMEILSDIFFRSTFPEEEAEREKGVVIEEIHRSLDDPDDVCFDALSTALYGNTAKGRPILGTAENVRSFKPAELREYMKLHYGARNTVISVAGKIEYERAAGLAEKYFDSLFTNVRECATMEKVAPVYGYVGVEKQIEQAVIAMAFPGYAYSDRRAVPLKIASNILGGGMSSRLFQSVRERKGLAYDVYSLPGAAKDDGVLEIYLGTNPESVREAVQTVAEEISGMKRGVTEEELRKAKEQLKTGTVLGSESATALMRAAGRAYVLSGQTYDVDKVLTEIEAVTLSDVTEVIEETFDFDKVAASFVAKDASVNVRELLLASEEEL